MLSYGTRDECSLPSNPGLRLRLRPGLFPVVPYGSRGPGSPSKTLRAPFPWPNRDGDIAEDFVQQCHDPQRLRQPERRVERLLREPRPIVRNLRGEVASQDIASKKSNPIRPRCEFRDHIGLPHARDGISFLARRAGDTGFGRASKRRKVRWPASCPATVNRECAWSRRPAARRLGRIARRSPPLALLVAASDGTIG